MLCSCYLLYYDEVFQYFDINTLMNEVLYFVSPIFSVELYCDGRCMRTGDTPTLPSTCSRLEIFERVVTRYSYFKIISISDEELFSEAVVGWTVSHFVKRIWCSRWFCNNPLFGSLFAVTEGWLLLDIGWCVLFFYIVNNCLNLKSKMLFQ